MSTASQECKADSSKDVFISYSRRDKAWVDGYLTPMLQAARVNFAIDDRDFEVGVTLKENIRRLIKACRYTLLVMTPDWVNGKWTDYESELAVEGKTEAEEVSVLALKLKDCDVPPHIAPMLYLDICQARTRDNEISKLLHQIGVSEERIAEARQRVAKKQRWFLIELLTEPGALKEVSKLKQMFLKIQHSNNILLTNKTLHDRLQEMEFPLKPLKGFLVDQGRSAGELDWPWVKDATFQLCEKLEGLVGFAASVPNDLVDVNFVAPLNNRAEDIESAFYNRDERRFRSFIELISRQVDKSLPLLNDRIVQHVKERRLSDLVDNLQSIYELVVVDEIEFDLDVSALLRQFRSKIDELVELEQVIQKKVDDHGTLQQAEVLLHLCSPADEPTFFEIECYWADIQAFVDKLKLTERYEKLLRYSRLLNEQVNDVTVRDDRFEDSVKQNFERFVHEMKKSFNILDIDLLSDCGKLKPSTDDLQTLLKRMHNNDV